MKTAEAIWAYIDAVVMMRQALACLNKAESGLSVAVQKLDLDLTTTQKKLDELYGELAMIYYDHL